MTKEEFIEYLGERLTYEDIEKADAEAKAYVKGFIEGLDARPEPLGKWLFKEITDDYHVTGRCSICKKRRRIDNYCPNCGARMVNK